MENLRNMHKENTILYKTTINCGGCVKAVTPALEKVKGIKSWEVDTGSKDKILRVQYYGNNTSEIAEAVKNAGFKAEKITEN